MNFGERKMPKTKCRTKGKPVLTDVQMPCPQPYCWAHIGREPDTNQHVRILEFKQTKERDYIAYTNSIREAVLKDKFDSFFAGHTIKRRFRTELDKRVKNKMEEYEAAIDKRREKLRDLFYKEEREYYRETIDNAQKGDVTKDDTMKEKCEILKAKKEEERIKVAEEKRLQQYMNRCVDLREVMSKKYLVESKNGQLQQMRENQARRESEKEIDRLWHDIQNKEWEAKREREEYEALEKHLRDKEAKDTWAMQRLGKEKLKEEEQKMAYEEKIELNRLREQMRNEDQEALIKKQRKKDKIDKELREQIAVNEQLMTQRKKEEDALTQAFTMLTQMEIDRENAMIMDTTTAAKKEMAQYRANLEELKYQQKEEENQLEEFLENTSKEIQKKQDDVKCKLEAAKRKMLKDVMEGRAEQLKHKQEIAEEQLKMQQADNELTRMAFETNAKLAKEMERQECLARKQYQHDLLQQIEYKKRLQEREKEELERQLALGMREEERYLKMVKDLCRVDTLGVKHPFRCMIEKTGCYCPEDKP